MNARTTLAAVLLALLLAACAACGLAWHRAYQHSIALADALRARDTAPSIATPQPAPAATSIAKDEAASHLEDDIAARAALLAEARTIPEVARRESALRVILRIKQEHERTPPPPKPLPPPFPKDGSFFPELLTDPAYLAYQLESWRKFSGDFSGKRMQRLGIPESVRQQIIDLEFDRYAASLEAQRFTRDQPAELTAARQAAAEISKETAEKIRTLLGEELAAQYQAPERFMPMEPAQEFSQLLMRLSYSATPLTASQLEQLGALSQSIALPEGSGAFAARLESIKAGMRTILSDQQWTAVDELAAEREAENLRRKLPKSSELPRAKRRARLEGAK
ncbi:MAG: hypothetical protein IAE82_19935 [Opitutaceae bacterium]|nr:hypothetical protein [Opitutaceae bacterium]